MEWKFERTARTMLDAFSAMQGVRDTLPGRRHVRMTGVALVLMIVLVMAFSYPWSAPRLLVSVVLLVPACVLFVLYERWANPRLMLRQVRAEGELAALLGIQTVRLVPGALEFAGPGEIVWRHEAAQIARAVPTRQGVVVVLRDGGAEFLPLTAFDAGHSLPGCVAAINRLAATAAVGQGRA